MNFPPSRFVPGLLLALIVISTSGCAGQPLKVEGRVELDGTPVDSGSISFEPADGKGRDFGGAISAGKYMIVSPPGVEPGTRIVRISAMRKTGRQIPAGSPSPPGTMVDEIAQAPKRYNEKSELSANLEAGMVNQFDFKLKSDPLP